MLCREHPDATSGIISLKKSCLFATEKAGTAIGSSNRLGGEDFYVQLWSQRSSISPRTSQDGAKAGHKCPCMLHEACTWEEDVKSTGQ